MNHQRVRDFRIAAIPHQYSEKDTMLYALGLGIGADPMDEQQLRFVYEKDLQALPTFGGVVGYPGFWPKDNPDLGINWQRLLNGEQGIELHRPLPPSGNVIGSFKVDEIVDKGADKGAVIYVSRDVKDAATGELLFTVTNSVFCRGDGGFGGPKTPARPVATIPDRAPDQSVTWSVLPQLALIYRLSGDYNPLHAEPAIARQGGFERPILHGAATWGIAGYALQQALCDNDPTRFQRYQARFTSPVYPGDVLRTDIWLIGAGEAVFRVVVPGRNVVALDNGTFGYR